MNSIQILKEVNKISRSRIYIMLVDIISEVTEYIINNILFIPFIYLCINSKYSVYVLVKYCIIMIIVLLIISLYKGWRDNIYLPLTNNKIRKHFYMNIYKKASEIDIKYYDDEHYYNKYIWIMKDIDKRVINIINTITTFLNNIVSLILIIGMIIYFDFFILIFALLPTIISIIFGIKTNKISFEMDKKFNTINRKIDYIDRVHYLNEYSSELRIFNIQNVMINLFNKECNNAVQLIKKYGNKLNVLCSLKEISVTFIGANLSLIYLIYLSLVKQRIDVSIVIALSGAIFSVGNTVASIFNIIPTMHRNNMYIKNYYEFTV